MNPLSLCIHYLKTAGVDGNALQRAQGDIYEANFDFTIMLIAIVTVLLNLRFGRPAIADKVVASIEVRY
jgi:hypothetical protein